MNSKPQLGKIEAVGARHVWADEAADFTPWLAEEKNIALLGEALGLELEVESTEVAVGPYSADILAKDTGTGRFVVIENQLAKTNHDHLGKAVTYASALDATAVVWIAPEFTEEHQKALEWLNDHTTEDLAFYAVLLEVWRIENSPPAVRFNVISRPAGAARKAAVTRAEHLTDAKKLQFDFWTRFREKLLEAKVVPSAHTARPQYWFDIALGRAYINLSAIADTSDNRIGLRVYISNHVAEKALPQLLEQREDIERDIGAKLEWDPNPAARDKVIALNHSADLQDRSKWPEHIDWLVKTVAKFRAVFVPRVRALNLED